MTAITLLDGGIGQEIVHRAGDRPTPRWSTQVMLERPDLVAGVHRDYADAGATVATTNSYALHRDRLRGGSSNHYAAAGTDLPDIEDRFEALHEAAWSAVDAVRPRCRIAGSIGPLGASYRPDLHPDFDTAVPLYAEVVRLIAPHVDLLLFETIASLDAARACLAAGRRTDLPVWLALTVDDAAGDRLRSGEPVSEAARIGADADAVLANCSAPEAMPAALDALRSAGVPMGAYANAFTMITKDFIAGGKTTDGLTSRRDMGPETYADHAMTWIDMGATIVGGCCETGPAHIAEIARRLTAAGHDLT
jgi:S-methylmethionine-dependent homocysteine/selenocysteine methylase